MHEPEGMWSASSSSASSPSTAPATMAPKKKSGASAHPSTSKAPPPAASNAAGDAEAHEDVDAAGDVVGAGGTVTTSPAADTGMGDIGGEQHQQHLGGHTPQGAGEGVTPSAPPPLTDGHSRNNGARSKASHRPPATPTTGAATARVLPLGRAGQTVALDRAANPRAPPSCDPAAQVVIPQLRGRDTTPVAAAGAIRSQATMRPTPSTSMPRIATNAMP